MGSLGVLLLLLPIPVKDLLTPARCIALVEACIVTIQLIYIQPYLADQTPGHHAMGLLVQHGLC
jgi:hypothetical protein